MSQENVDLVRRLYEHFEATREFLAEDFRPDFVMDLSKIAWPEQPTYHGVEGVREFIAAWLDAWDDYHQEIKALHDADDKVVATMYMRGRSRATGLAVDMHFAHLWFVRDGQLARMEGYGGPSEALEAAGLPE